jgi:phosphatidate phosphatase APP1
MMMRRYCTDERPGAQVRARLSGQEQLLTADDEGYFEADFALPQPLDPRERLHDVELELLKPLGRHQSEVRAIGKVQLPPADAHFGIISDIDDTVIHTGATNFLRMVRVVMLGNARTRLAFKGVSAFYQALQEGVSGGCQNPIFYVTSSPWNIYDVVCEVFRVHGIPVGPLFMKDYGFDETKFIKSSHGSHKLAAIRRILALYPDLPFILIGDSGQKDPEIYREIVRDFPERIRAIYIRDVTQDPARDEAVHALGREVGKTGTSLILSKDTIAAAHHAVESGFIAPAALAMIDQDRKDDESEPTVAEKLLNQQT